MDSGESSCFGIAQQNRNAIRCFCTDQYPAQIADQAIGTILGIADIIDGSHGLDRVAVNLPDGRERIFTVKCCKKTSSIFVNILRIVLVKTREI